MAVKSMRRSHATVAAFTAILMLGLFMAYQTSVESTRGMRNVEVSSANTTKCSCEQDEESAIRILEKHFSDVTVAPIRTKAPVTSSLMYLQAGTKPVCKNGTIDHGCYCMQGTNVYPPENKLLSQYIRRKRGCKKRRPDVIIPGTMKSGTTALKAYLEIHPAITFPRKELKFANHHSLDEFDQYRSVMPYSTPDQIAIEKTAGYFNRIPVVEKIGKVMPDTKFIIILREPIHRAMSNYMHMLAVNASRLGTITVKEYSSAPQYEIKSTFQESVLFPNGSLKTANRLLDTSNYVKYLEQWYNIFPRRQILVLDGEEFTKDPLLGLRKVEDFLEIDRFFDKSKFFFNETKGFICLRDPFVMCMTRNKGRPHETISDDLMKKLQDYFRPYNRKLVKVLQRELSWTNSY